MLVASLLLAAVLAFAGTHSVDLGSQEIDPSVHVGALASPAECSGDGAQATSIAEAVNGARAAAATEAADGARTTAAAEAADGVESAGSDRFIWAIRGLNVQVLSERVSERKPISEQGFDSDATRPTTIYLPAYCIARAASHGHAAPPRLLFYLHGALLI